MKKKFLGALPRMEKINDQSVFHLHAFLLNVIMLSVVMLNVVAPLEPAPLLNNRLLQLERVATDRLTNKLDFIINNSNSFVLIFSP